MPSHLDRMLSVLRDAGIVRVEWRMFYYNDEGDFDSVVATFSDGSRCPVPEDVTKKIGGIIWYELADDERLDGQGNWTNGLFVLDVEERTVTRTAEVFCDFDQEIDDAERVMEKRWHEYVGWGRKSTVLLLLKLIWKQRILGREFDWEAAEKEADKEIDRESYISVTPLENPQQYSL